MSSKNKGIKQFLKLPKIEAETNEHPDYRLIFQIVKNNDLEKKYSLPCELCDKKIVTTAADWLAGQRTHVDCITYLERKSFKYTHNLIQFRKEAVDILACMPDNAMFAAVVLEACGYLKGELGAKYTQAIALRQRGMSTSEIIARLAPEGEDTAPLQAKEADAADIDLAPSAGPFIDASSQPSTTTPTPAIPWQRKHVAALDNLIQIDKLAQAKEGLCESTAYQFFVDCMVGELWTSYCRLEDIGEDLKQFVGPIADRTTASSRLLSTVAQTFMRQLDGALSLPIPLNFRPMTSAGKPIKLRMMQLLVAWHLSAGRRQRFGNWSAPGAGKTVGALFTAKVLGSRLTVVLCPNHVIPTWHNEIDRTYNHNKRLKVVLAAKTWTPPADTDILVINYDQLQGKTASADVANFAKTYGALVGLVVLDECHRTKNNGKIGQAAESSRRKVVEELLTALPDAKVLIQTGTPILTNCAEGSSMLSMLDSQAVEQYKLTGRNSFKECVRLHCAFSRHGVRFKPSIRSDSGSDSAELALHEPSVKTTLDGRFCRDKNQGLELVDPHRMARLTEVPGSIFDSLKGKQLNWCEYDELATPHKIPAIVAALRPGTIVYSEYVAEGRTNPIVQSLASAVIAAGFSVAVFDGGSEGSKAHDASLLNACKCKRCQGLAAFKAGSVDVLVASRILGEGVDGLQGVASRLVVNSPPWTDGSWDQLVGRLYRAGQRQAVEVIVPVLWFSTPQGDASLDMLRLARIAERGSIADAVLDGQFPTHTGGSQELIRRAKEELAKLSGEPDAQGAPKVEIKRFVALAKAGR